MAVTAKTTGRSTPTSFTVRIWRETGKTWRGQIIHVQSGKTRYFQDQQRFWEFVWRCAGISEDEAAAECSGKEETHVDDPET